MFTNAVSFTEILFWIYFHRYIFFFTGVDTALNPSSSFPIHVQDKPTTAAQLTIYCAVTVKDSPGPSPERGPSLMTVLSSTPDSVCSALCVSVYTRLYMQLTTCKPLRSTLYAAYYVFAFISHCGHDGRHLPVAVSWVHSTEEISKTCFAYVRKKKMYNFEIHLAGTKG